MDRNSAVGTTTRSPGWSAAVTTPTPTETAGSSATRELATPMSCANATRARSDTRSHSTQMPVPASHSASAWRIARSVGSGGSPYVAVSR